MKKAPLFFSTLVTLNFAAALLGPFSEASPLPSASPESVFKSAIELKVGVLPKSNEIRMTYSEIQEGLCGGDGPSLVATLEVLRFKKEYNEKTENVELVSYFEPVKSWGILKSEARYKIAEVAKRISADDQCLE